MNKVHIYTIFFLLYFGVTITKSNAQSFPNPATLSTGQGAQGTNDPIWQVSDWFYTLPQSPLALGYLPAYISNNCAPGLWVDPTTLPPPVNNGNWVSGSDMICTGVMGYRFFRLTLNLPPDCNGNSLATQGSYVLYMDGYADNILIDVMINGVSENLPNLPGGSFSAGTQVSLTIDGPWAPGVNYVDFLVYNGGGPYGLLMVANSVASSMSDSDGDGVSDLNDICPCEFGTNPYGCNDPLNLNNCDAAQIRAAFSAAGCVEIFSCMSSCSMYFLNPQPLSGTDAQTFAQGLGANLISIQNAAENQCIIDDLNDKGESGVIWIGFSDELVEGTYVWYDQSPVVYTNWAAGEPNQSGNEDYVQIYPNGQWNDLAFSGSAKSIIEVNLCPIVDAGIDQTICSGTPTTITASNTLFGSFPYTYQWTNGALTQSTSVSPIVTTTYGVVSTDRYNCLAADTIVVTVYDNPTVTVSSNSLVCDAAIVATTNFTSPTLNTTFDWTNDNINIGLAASGTGDIASFIATNTTTSPITANITVTPTANGCVGTPSTYTITVYPLPTANFNFTTVCFGTATAFEDLSNPNGGILSTWSWDFTNNGTVDNNTQNPSNIFPTAGSYTVELLVATTLGCADSVTLQVVVNPIPVANFTFVNACFGTPIAFTDNSSVTSGTITNWNWNFGNGNTSIIQNPAQNYSSEGVYNVQLIATSNNGCTDTITQQVEVWPIPIANYSSTEVCLNAASQFTDSSTVSNTYTVNNIAQWNWNFNGQGSSVIQNPSFIFNTAAVNPTTLTVTSNNGCSNSITLNVTVDPLPQVIFGNPTAGCAPTMCVNFTNNSTINTGTIVSWQWDFGDGFSSSLMIPPHCYENSSYSVLQNFDVTLTAISDKQCTTTVIQPAMITVYPKPLADFDYTPLETDIYDNEITFMDQSIIANSWSWNMGDGGLSIENNPIHIYQDSGFYLITLSIENSYGCKDTTQKTVKINPVYTLFIPNAFTPDGDGINDYFFIESYGLTDLQTMIFDKWGELLYESQQLKSKWDGFYKGKKCINDSYVYRIKAKDIFDEWHEYVGRIILLR